MPGVWGRSKSVGWGWERVRREKDYLSREYIMWSIALVEKEILKCFFYRRIRVSHRVWLACQLGEQSQQFQVCNELIDMSNIGHNKCLADMSLSYLHPYFLTPNKQMSADMSSRHFWCLNFWFFGRHLCFRQMKLSWYVWCFSWCWRGIKCTYP